MISFTGRSRNLPLCEGREPCRGIKLESCRPGRAVVGRSIRTDLNKALDIRHKKMHFYNKNGDRIKCISEKF